MKKVFLTALIALCALNAAAQQPACLARGKALFDAKEYPAAEQVLETCLKEKPNNGEVYISLAGVQMVLGKFARAENSFKYAMRALPAKSPYIAYVNSLLGDISMRKANLKDAAFFYDAALRAEPANINALVGKGITEEKAGHAERAADYFNRALAVDFTNIVARERLIALEPGILSYEELLLALRERNIIDPSVNTFSPADEALLSKMITAEKDNAIEYLSGKYSGRIPPGLVVERDSGKVYVRKMLTTTGYSDLIAHLSHDAKQFFRSQGVVAADLFKLKDFDGKAVFDDKGHLTDPGLAVYTKSLYGQKAHLAPGETMPSTQREIDALIKQYQRQGYSEISQPEFAYLMRETRCSEQTLIKDVSVKVVNLDSQRKRVFIVTDPRRQDLPAILPYSYIADYRARARSGGGQAPVATSGAFGLGGGVEVKLCSQNGTLASDSIREVARQQSAKQR